MRVRLYLTEKYICVEVQSGCADAAQAKAVADSDESGRGLWLVSGIADRWAVTSDHAGMWCTLPIDTAESKR